MLAYDGRCPVRKVIPCSSCSHCQLLRWWPSLIATALFAPSNVLLHRVRARPTLTRITAILVVAGGLSVAMKVLSDTVVAGAPGWLNLVVVVLAWDGLKFGLFAIGLACQLTVRATFRSRPAARPEKFAKMVAYGGSRTGSNACARDSDMLPGDSADLRKARGAFFTPDKVARFITDWAIRSAADAVIEPSCGEAVFLHQIDRGHTRPHRRSRDPPRLRVGSRAHAQPRGHQCRRARR